MKKTFKRAGVAVLSMAMLLSMGTIGAISANAADVTTAAQTITMPSTPAAAKYTIYPVATAAVNAGGKTYDYTLVNEFSDVTVGGNAITIASIAAMTNNSSSAHDLADALAADTSKPNATASNLNAGATQNLVPGYYLILSSGTSMTAAPILLSVTSDMDDSAKTLTAKSSDLTFDKNITAITNGSVSGTNPCKTAEGAVGSIVSYEIVTQFPSYAASVASKDGDKLPTNFSITDNPSAGLTIDNSSITVTVTSPSTAAVQNTHYTVNTSSVGTTNGGSGFVVTFTDDNYVLANGGKTVTVTFTATINANAVSQTAIPNDATLTYANDYNTGTGSDTKTSDTDVFRTDVKIYKNNTGTNAALQGAGFTLYDSTGNTEVVAEQLTPVNGYITFDQLPAGTYVLKETTVPDGFKKCADTTITVTATKDNTTHEYTGEYTITPTYDATKDAIKIDNTPGETLPATGGIGTVMFTVGGAAIILFAGVMFVLYMRKRRSEEE